MSHKVNAKAIGAFTILAVVLLVAGVLTFGSGDLFRTEYDVEMVFTGSVKGLNKGSAITFRGVRIGEVKEVNLDFEGMVKTSSFGWSAHWCKRKWPIYQPQSALCVSG